MRHYLLLLFGLLTLIPLRAQPPAVVLTGRVIDAETGQPISGASIVTTANRKKGTYSFGNGTFRLPVAAGQHELRVSSVGYQPLTQTVGTSDRDITFVDVTPRDARKSTGRSTRRVATRATARPPMPRPASRLAIG